jgi:predicted ATPase
MVEQPELHIHPQLQANLGDLFIEAIKEGKQFFLETHSENLLLRLLRRIRHTSEGRSEDNNSLTPADLQVLYVLPAGHDSNRYSGAAVMTLPISEDGDFLDEWPNGFFEERSVELFQ